MCKEQWKESAQPAPGAADSKLPLRERGEKKKKKKKKAVLVARSCPRAPQGQDGRQPRASQVPQGPAEPSQTPSRHSCAKCGQPPRLASPWERARRGCDKGRWFLTLIKTAATSKGGSEGLCCLQAPAELSQLLPRHCHAPGAKARAGTGPGSKLTGEPGRRLAPRRAARLRLAQALSCCREEDNSPFSAFFLHLARSDTTGSPAPQASRCRRSRERELQLEHCRGANRRARPGHGRAGVRPETMHTSHLFLNPLALELLGLLLRQDLVPLGLAPVVWEVLWWGAGCPSQFTSHTHTHPMHPKNWWAPLVSLPLHVCFWSSGRGSRLSGCPEVCLCTNPLTWGAEGQWDT